MLGGYNCTLLAYGQTGTGKTYTMSGDMSKHHGGIPHATAGIIPRALAQIFQDVEHAGDSAYVTCSFIELYNEKPRDLLAIHDDQKVQMREDPKNKDKLILKGLEEVTINDASHGIEILQRGSKKREVAATKCNQASSRSHTIFTITVKIKQDSAEGDMRRTGKLNLVDLAGSENVGKSGAVDQRAQETGSINKSLLALGRVINDLVDRAPCPPFRESNLTRLLRDSLAGRTQTCIIATLSPAKINMDETVSTLDYAHRAKSIKNKPQVNQMIKEETFVKGIIQENERLKRDLDAAQAKNGVWMTLKERDELRKQNDFDKLHIEELKRKIDSKDWELEKKNEQIENAMTLSQQTKQELARNILILNERTAQLDKSQESLARTYRSWQQEIHLREKHQKREAELEADAQELISVLGSTVGDNDGLHAKIERKRAIEDLNRKTWTSISQEVSTSITAMETSIHGHGISSNNRLDDITHLSTTSEQKVLKILSTEQQSWDLEIQNLVERTKLDESALAKSRRQFGDVLKAMKVLGEEMNSCLEIDFGKLKDTAQNHSEKSVRAMIGLQEDIYERFQELESKFKGIFSRIEKHRKSQSDIARTLNDLVLTVGNKVTALAQMARERVDSDGRKSKDSIARLQMMLDNFVQEELTKRQETDEVYKREVEVILADMQVDNAKTKAHINNFAECDMQFGQIMNENKGMVKGSLVEIWQKAKTATATASQSIDANCSQYEQLINAAKSNVDKMTRNRVERETEAAALFSEHDKRGSGALSSVCAHIEANGRFLWHNRQETEKEIRAWSHACTNITAEQRTAILDLGTIVAHESEKVRKRTASSMQEDEPTQETPKKRDYHYPNPFKSDRRHSEFPFQRDAVPCENAERNPLSDVDVNLTSPALAQTTIEILEDELAAPAPLPTTFPHSASKSRGHVGEKEVIKAIMVTGQENDSRSLRTRKRQIT